MHEPAHETGKRQHHDGKHDREPVCASCVKIAVHEHYSFCFARAFIRSASATGSMPAAAEVASTCLARLSTCTAWARTPIGGGGLATKLPFPRISVMAPSRSNSS